MSEQSLTNTAHGNRSIKVALVFLLITFMLGMLCLQAFNLVFGKIGEDLGAGSSASLITAIPTIVLGIICFVYGSLGDFVSLKKMTIIGMTVLLVGSLLGFFVHGSLLLVVIARCIQTAGAQVAGSVYLVMTMRYIEDSKKVLYFGLFTAGYQLSTAIGVLAGGILSSVDWSILFLIPVIGVLFTPALIRLIPENETSATHVDVPGFIIFGAAIMMLTLFFSYGFPYLIAAIALFVVFAIYINKAKNPFITPQFFKNRAWLCAITLILFFYFINYSFSPVFNSAGISVYGLETASISFYLLWGSIVGCIFALCSGKIVEKIGRGLGIIIACILVICGCLLAGLFLTAGMIPLTISFCLCFAGMGLIYGPIVNTAVDTVAPEEAGRAIGMNDLMMNVSASIGVTFASNAMAAGAFKDLGIAGHTGQAATDSAVMYVFGIVMLVGLVLYFMMRRNFKNQAAA